jgi:iron complex outermembrane receptor protein
MRHGHLSTLLFIALLSSVPPALAQQPTVISGTVTTRADGLSLPGAEVTLPDLGLSTTTDTAGSYTLTVPAERAQGQTVALQVRFPGLGPQSVRIRLAPGSISQDFALVLGFQEEITVGSRTPGVAAQQAVPVNIITSAEIKAVGFSETTQIIQALAPSFNFPRPTITDGTDTVRPATLRGLGPDQVLVLINGKRRHTSALVHVNGSIGRGSTGVDLNAIPPAAIEKIEILRDGAAAQYGSDAIAGVINIVLRSGALAPQLTYKIGQTSEGDGELNEVEGVYGFNLLGGSVLLTGTYRDRNRTNRAGPDPRAQGTDPGVASPNQPNHRWGDGDTNDAIVFADAQWPLAANRFLYAYGGFSRRLGNSAGFYRLAGDARNWKAIYPQGFLPQIEPDVVDGSAAGGVRGAARGWFYDASLVWGHNSFDFHVTNSLNASLGPTVPPNQTEFYAGSLLFDQLVANVDMSRLFDTDRIKRINVAFGAEVRREHYQILAGEPNSYLDGGRLSQLGTRAAPGAQVFPGFRPSNEVDRSRSSAAGYVDVEADVAPRVRAGAAGRFEHFTDFGSTADGKVTVRVEPVRQFVVRGAVSTGFRAPSLQQSYFNTVSTNFINVGGGLQPFEVGTFPVDSPIARALGARDLEPEQSLHYSGGVVIEPVEHLSITVDGYRVAIDDRVVFSGNFTGGAITAILQPFGATGARFFTNAINTRTTGVDVEAVYGVAVGTTGRLRLSGAYNHNRTRIVGEVSTPAPLAGLGNVLFDRVERRRIECAQPRDSFQLAGNATRGPVGILLRTHRYGEFCNFSSADPVTDQIFTPKWITDLDASYTVGGARFQVGVQNVFDIHPDENTAAGNNNFFGIQVYPSHSPFGMNGRFFYARVGYAF